MSRYERAIAIAQFLKPHQGRLSIITRRRRKSIPVLFTTELILKLSVFTGRDEIECPSWNLSRSCWARPQFHDYMQMRKAVEALRYWGFMGELPQFIRRQRETPGECTVVIWDLQERKRLQQEEQRRMLLDMMKKRANEYFDRGEVFNGLMSVLSDAIQNDKATARYLSQYLIHFNEIPLDIARTIIDRI